VLFIFWFAFDRKFILKPQFYLFLLFFIIGFSPRFYFAEGIKPAFERALNFLHAATSWQNPFFTYSIVKTKAFFLKDLLRLFNFEHLPCIIQYIYYSLFGVSFFYLLWRSMRNIILLKNINKIMAKETPFLMFFLIFSLAYIFSCYTIWNGWECAGYLVPLYPAIFVIIAVSLDKFIRVKNRLLKISTVIFLSLILSAGFYENLGLISFHKIGRGFIWKGYSYRVFGWTVGRQFQDNDKALEIIKNIYSPERRFFLEGLGWGVAGYDNPTRETDILQENIIKRFSLNNQDRLYYYEGIGKGLAHRMNLYLHHQKGNLKIAMNILQGIMKRKEAGVMRYFWKGFGQDNEFLSDTYQMVKDYMEEQFKPYLWEGAGETAALFYLNDDSVNPPNTLLNITDFKYRKYIYSGYTGVRSELLLKDLK
jgi:uncharacterized protein (UPF0332 family)